MITPLEEFDREGRQYDYVLLELESTVNYSPSYDTERTEEGYYTLVTNSPGKGNRILVRKEWKDDSDIIHREPVTIEVRLRESRRVIAAVTLGSGEEGSGENVWQQLVGIGKYRPEEVYITEAKAADSPVEAPSSGPSRGSERSSSITVRGIPSMRLPGTRRKITCMKRCIPSLQKLERTLCIL